MFNLTGKTTVVTGSGTAIGRELALAFARAGGNVVCVGRREKELLETVDAIRAQGGKGLAVPADVTVRDQVDAMVSRTLAAFGQIDLLFNNHGSFGWVGPVWEADPEVWWRDVTINLLGSMLTCRAVLPHMMKRNTGVLINMDGGGGSNGPNIGGSAYGCSKAALLRFTEGLSIELSLAKSDVLAVCMNPGFVHTPMTESIVSTPRGLQWQSFVREWIDQGVGKKPDDCAKATMKLLQILSPELNGRIFSVETDYDDVDRRKADIVRDNLLTLHLKQ